MPPDDRRPVLPATRPPAAANCGFGRGCGQAQAAQSSAGGEALARNHPCYSEEAHHHFARLHVAVAPACNIQCHYCNRKFDCASESRPGVVSEKLTPEQAVAKVRAVAAEVPSLSVVGIAGPGDALARPELTFAALEGIRREAPDLTLCLSTNGLMLPDHVDRLVELGVHHVTITINMTDPAVGEQIYPWVLWEGRKVRGREASRLLSERQLEGLARLAARGVLCKVNAVVIPGVNDRHLPEVVRTARRLGAFMVNLLPLISAPEHGTHYGLTHQRGPTADELERLQAACELDARLMRHCRQCRADAVGTLGQDRFAEFTRARLPPGPVRDATELRAEHREAVDRVRARADRARRAALARAAEAPAFRAARVAVATRGDGKVDQHFGHATEFLIYEVGREGARLLGLRRVGNYCLGGEGDEDALAATLRALEGCQAVLVAKVGRCPSSQLEAAGIEPVTAFAFEPIEAAAISWWQGWAARQATSSATVDPAVVRATSGATVPTAEVA